MARGTIRHICAELEATRIHGLSKDELSALSEQHYPMIFVKAQITYQSHI